jgi:hypothetical protein
MLTAEQTRNFCKTKTLPSVEEISEFDIILGKIGTSIVNNDLSIFVFSIFPSNQTSLKKLGYTIIKSSDGFWISWEKFSLWDRFINWVFGKVL